MIRYQSLSMPIMVLSETPDKENEKTTINDEDDKPADDSNANTQSDTPESIK